MTEGGGDQVAIPDGKRAEAQVEPGVEPIHVAWNDYRRQIDWDLPGSKTWGFHRGAYPFLEASHVRGRMIRLPAGQASPATADAVNRIVVQVVGEVEFYVNSRILSMEPYDLLMLPSGTTYRYMNVGLEDAMFFDLSRQPAAGQVTPSVRTRSEPASSSGPVLLRWKEYRRSIDWSRPDADVWGFHRGVYPWIEAPDMKGHVVFQPAGQSSPKHGGAAEIVFLQLYGETEFQAASKIYLMRPRDLLLMPPTPYVYTNVGVSPALFIDLFGTPPPGVEPAKATYYDLKSRR